MSLIIGVLQPRNNRLRCPDLLRQLGLGQSRGLPCLADRQGRLIIDFFFLVELLQFWVFLGTAFKNLYRTGCFAFHGLLVVEQNLIINCPTL